MCDKDTVGHGDGHARIWYDLPPRCPRRLGATVASALAGCLDGEELSDEHRTEIPPTAALTATARTPTRHCRDIMAF